MRRLLRIISFRSFPATTHGRQHALCVFICALSALSLVSCQRPTSSVEHYAELVKEPDLDCVLEQLRAIATHNAVQVLQDGIPLGINHRFIFEADGVPHHMGILFRPDHTASLRHTSWAPHLKLVELQAAQRSLGTVEKLLADRCDSIDYGTVVQESCYGKNCEQLQAFDVRAPNEIGRVA